MEANEMLDRYRAEARALLADTPGLEVLASAEFVGKMALSLLAARDEGAVEAHQLWHSGVLPAKPL